MLDQLTLEQSLLSRPHLATVFSTHWETPLREYASLLYDKAPSVIERDLVDSFREEWESVGYPTTLVERSVDQLTYHPVLQTAHHITPTNGPTFFALDVISLAGLAPESVYLVGANSGVAFSNTAWTGALSYRSLCLEDLLRPDTAMFYQARRSARERGEHGRTENRITLIPSRQRDQLVFGSTIGRFQLESCPQFSSRLSDLISEMRRGEPYSYWAARTCAAIERRVLRRENVLIFDINRVIARYLVKVLSGGEDHPVCELLFPKSKGGDLLGNFESAPHFLGSYQGKKSYKVNHLYWCEGRVFDSRKGDYSLSKTGLIEKIRDDLFCPGIFLLFFVVRFLNGIKCLGSFHQIEYLERFRKTWMELVDTVDFGLDLEPDYQNALTTGRLLRDGEELYPLDLAINGESISLADYADKKMSFFWRPLLKQLTGR